MKDNPKTTGSASAVDKIRSLISKAGDLQHDLHKLNCFATIAEARVCDMFPTQRAVNDRPGFYYVGDADRKILGFASNEALAFSNGAETSVDDLIDDLKEVLDLLRSSTAQ
jgi:hypothetical protein